MYMPHALEKQQHFTASLLTAPCVQVLPPGENKTQKIAVGDLSGVVQCFCIKKGEVALTFKTLPAPQKASESCKLCCKHGVWQLQWSAHSNWVQPDNSCLLKLACSSSCSPEGNAAHCAS
jgi:hypothetical protein